MMYKTSIGIVLTCALLAALAHGQWQPDRRLTNDGANSLTSPNNAWCVAASGDNVHVVWTDHRDGNWEIYYKRNPTGNQVVVAEPELPHLCHGMRITPNPLTTGVATLRFSLPRPVPVLVTVFNIAGRAVLRHSAFGVLQSAMPLDLRKVPAGVYLVRLDADGYSASQTLLVQRKDGRN